MRSGKKKSFWFRETIRFLSSVNSPIMVDSTPISFSVSMASSILLGSTEAIMVPVDEAESIC